MPRYLYNQATILAEDPPPPIVFPEHSDQRLQVEALAARREADEQLVINEYHNLWGYLQPVGRSEKEDAPYFDFRNSRTGYRIKFKVPLNDERTRFEKHGLLITRGADDQPAYLRNVSDILIVTVNAQEMLQGESCRLEHGDRLGLSHTCGTILYDYVYRDGLAEVKEGDIDEHYVPGTLLGRGAFADTSSTVHCETRTYYAAKRIKQLPNTPTYEISCMKELRHPNICELKDVFFHHDGTIYLVMDLCRHGTLLKYINDQPQKYLVEEVARDITSQICSGMAYAHSLNIVHRDLKPENILMASLNPPQIKIADFGLAKSTELHGVLTSNCGTEMYVAPELYLRLAPIEPYDNRVDSWSVGVIVVAMLTGHMPYAPRNTLGWQNEEFIVRISRRELTLSPLRQRGYRDASLVYQFVQALLTIEPEIRVTLNGALGLAWLRLAAEALVEANEEVQNALDPEDDDIYA